MNTTTKGALAAVTAAALLLGGAGTLAYWQSDASVTGEDLGSGRLALVDARPGQWRLNSVMVADPSAVRVVPGDRLTWSGSFEVDAEGDKLTGSVAVVGADAGGTLAPYVQTTALEYTVGGEATTTITDADDGERLDVSIAVDFPFGSEVDNSSQGKVLDVSDVSVTVTQSDAAAQP
jgi:alternate signal-mediated exported protein